MENAVEVFETATMSEEKTIGHTIDAKTRTIDVEFDRNVAFEQLSLHPSVLSGK